MSNRASLFIFSVVLLAASFVHGQNSRVDGVVSSRYNNPAAGAFVAACKQPATILPSAPYCSPLAPLCASLTDISCNASTFPVQADGLGNYHFYISQGSGPYTYCFYGSALGVPTLGAGCLPDQYPPGVAGSGNFVANGDLKGSSTSQIVSGLDTVPFCTGFTPTNGQFLNYTTSSSPNPCYTAQTPPSTNPPGAAGNPIYNLNGGTTYQASPYEFHSSVFSGLTLTQLLALCPASPTPCTLYLDPSPTAITVGNTPAIIGSSTQQVSVIDNGVPIQCTGTVGTDCVDIAQWGSLSCGNNSKGPGASGGSGCVFTTSSNAVITSQLTNYDHGSLGGQSNFQYSGFNFVQSGTANITQAPLWVVAIEGKLAVRDTVALCQNPSYGVMLQDGPSLEDNNNLLFENDYFDGANNPCISLNIWSTATGTGFGSNYTFVGDSFGDGKGSSPSATTTAAITSTGSQTVTVSNTNNIGVSSSVSITGSDNHTEVVNVTGLVAGTSITATFTETHVNGSTIGGPCINADLCQLNIDGTSGTNTGAGVNHYVSGLGFFEPYFETLPTQNFGAFGEFRNVRGMSIENAVINGGPALPTGFEFWHTTSPFLGPIHISGTVLGGRVSANNVINNVTGYSSGTGSYINYWYPGDTGTFVFDGPMQITGGLNLSGLTPSSSPLCVPSGIVTNVGCSGGGGGGGGTGTQYQTAYYNPANTLVGAGPGLTGQSWTSNGSAAPGFLSPGLADSTNSPVTSTPYTIACDSGTTIVDRAHNLRFQSGAGAVTVPLSTASGCANLVTTVFDDGGGTLTFSRSSPDTFTVCTGATCTDSATSFTLSNGGYATLSQSASGIWEVRVATGGTVTSIATSSPITGGTITGSGTIACATCATTSNGGPISLDKSNTGLINPTADATFTYPASSVTGFELTGTSPASSASNGSSASFILDVVGVAGGATSSTGANTGGQGSEPQIYGGVGGNATGAGGTTTVGGPGGNVLLAAGAGGNGTAGNDSGGAGGDILLEPGTGGSKSGSGAVGANGSVVAEGPINSCPDTSGSGTAQTCNTHTTFTVSGPVCILYTTTTANSSTGLTVNMNSLGALSVAVPGATGWTATLTTSPHSIPANTPIPMCLNSAGTAWNVQQNGVGGGNMVNSSTTTTAGQIPLSTTTAGTYTPSDFPERYFIPAANCNNTTAGAGWSIPSGGTVTCRAGTNNLGGYVVITDTSSTFAQFMVTIPFDWDTSTRPYIRFYLSSASDTTNGHTVIPQIEISCPTAGNGTTTDDATFSAAQSSSTVTFGASAVAHGFYNTSNVQIGSTQMTGCIAGGLMIVQVGRATDTATGNIEFWGADVTFPRLLTVQAN